MTDGDLISRQAVKDLIRGLTRWCVRSQDRKFENVGLLYDDVMFGIDRLPSAENPANKININEYVKVKLTDYGKDIFYHQHDNLNKKVFGKEIIKPSYPTVDSAGYTSFQLWYFMNLYGRYIDMGMQNVIEPLEIIFESPEKTATWVGLDDYPHEDWECDEAIKRLNKIKAIYKGMDNKSDVKALDMAIEALQENEKLIKEVERWQSYYEDSIANEW